MSGKREVGSERENREESGGIERGGFPRGVRGKNSERERVRPKRERVCLGKWGNAKSREREYLTVWGSLWQSLVVIGAAFRVKGEIKVYNLIRIV
jgi:hypothetical protein